jgi:hypothetical protein
MKVAFARIAISSFHDHGPWQSGIAAYFNGRPERSRLIQRPGQDEGRIVRRVNIDDA